MAPITFALPSPYPHVEVTVPSELKCSREDLLSFRPFKDWLGAMQKSMALQSDRQHVFHAKNERYVLRSIQIQSVDHFGSRIGFVKMKTVVSNAEGHSLAGIVFLRGGSVAILIIIQPEGSNERYVVMTQQPRIPAGSLSFYEIPAGMIDDEGSFAGAAAKELHQETGLKIPASQLIDMTALALGKSQHSEDHLQKAMYPSPGGCDEFISLMLWDRPMSQTQLNEINGKIRGVDSERIKTKLVKYEHLWLEGARDAKTLAALALYEALTKDGSLANY